MHAVLSAIINEAAAASGANGTNGSNGTYGGSGWSWWWWVVAIVVFFILLGAFSRRPSPPPGRTPRTMPEEILKERFARGEITRQEYEERLKVLHGTA